MKNYISVLFALFLSVEVFAQAPFPSSPSHDLTPGDLCSEADRLRYPERIPYCERAVSRELKEDIIDTYDDRYGYEIRKTGRQNFKIDHYIPLCMGGSNDRDNLWPQHLSISDKTDKLEQVSCEKMSQGRLLQAKAVEYIREAKADPSRAHLVLERVSGL